MAVPSLIIPTSTSEPTNDNDNDNDCNDESNDNECEIKIKIEKDFEIENLNDLLNFKLENQNEKQNIYSYSHSYSQNQTNEHGHGDGHGHDARNTLDRIQVEKSRDDNEGDLQEDGDKDDNRNDERSYCSNSSLDESGCSDYGSSYHHTPYAVASSTRRRQQSSSTYNVHNQHHCPDRSQISASGTILLRCKARPRIKQQSAGGKAGKGGKGGKGEKGASKSKSTSKSMSINMNLSLSSFNLFKRPSFQEYYWVKYGRHCLVFFASREDCEEWLSNKTLTREERENLVRHSFDFEADSLSRDILGYKSTCQYVKNYRRQGQL